MITNCGKSDTSSTYLVHFDYHNSFTTYRRIPGITTLWICGGTLTVGKINLRRDTEELREQKNTVYGTTFLQFLIWHTKYDHLFTSSLSIKFMCRKCGFNY